jgi:proteasome lid subunit RPN8/RPN11
VANIKIRTTQNTSERLVRPRPDHNPGFKTFVSPADDFRAYIHLDVLNFIARHAESAGRYEVIGLLAGRICYDQASGRPYTVVMVADSARNGEFQSTVANVQLFAMGHAQVRRRLEDAHPDREVIGWYHTHPSFPPQFSGVDSEQQATWSNPNHIGIVYSGTDSVEPFGVYRGPHAILLTPWHRDNNHDAKQELNQTRRLDQPPIHQLTPRHEPPILRRRVPTNAWSAPLHARLKNLNRILLPAAAVLLACVLGGLFWISHRVSVVEARIWHLTNGQAEEHAQEQTPAQVQNPPLQNALPATASSPTVVADKTVDDSPELVAQTKPLAPTRTPQTQRERTSNAGSRRLKRTQKPQKKKAPTTGKSAGTQ